MNKEVFITHEKSANCHQRQFSGNPVISIESRFDINQSRFVTHVKSIRYKLTLLQVISVQNTTLYINDQTNL